MSLFNVLRGRYELRVKCTNCGNYDIVTVPRGVTKQEFIKREDALCRLCGCATLEMVKGKEESNGPTTKVKK